MPDRMIPNARPVERTPDWAEGEGAELESPIGTSERTRDTDLEQETLLLDMPRLKSPERLRIGEKNVLMNLVLDSDLMNRLSDTDGEMTPEETRSALSLIAGVDEFAESIAENRDAYVKWAEGKDYDVFVAILTRYTSALGKSESSTNS